MGRTKTQRETRFLNGIVIKTHQNNNKKYINFLERDRDLSIYFGGGPVLLIFFYCLKKLFEEMGGTMASAGPPLSPLSVSHP
jgi:hypothetical protein